MATFAMQLRLRPMLFRLLFSMLAAALIACGGSETTTGAPAASATERAAVVGDAEAAADTSGSGGILRIGMSAANIPIPNTPPTEGGEGSRFVGFQVYDGLLNWDLLNNTDRSALPGPGLVESYEIADDEVTWTLHLRQGVKFHDGTDFNADAVLFAMDRIANPDFEYYDPLLAGQNNLRTKNIATWEKVDDHTVVFTTVAPYAFLPYDLIYLYMPSPAAVMEWGNDEYAQHAIGTGPFKIVNYVDGEVMEFEANEDYWAGRPKLDGIVLYPMPEPATRLAALESGQVDWAEVPPPDAYERLEAAGYNVLLKPYPHVITYLLNLEKAPFDDIRVREALNLAQDREAVCSALLNGLCMPASQYVPPGHQWFDPDYEGYTYDPERAKELLAEAGYPDGFTMRIAYPPGGSGNMWPQPMNEKLQQDLAAIGVRVELVPIEWNNIISGYRAGLYTPEWSEYDAIHISLGASNPAGLGNYTTQAKSPNGCCNGPGLSDPEVDSLYEQAGLEFDIEEQDRLLTEMQVAMTSLHPYILTVHDLNFRVVSPNVRGFDMAQSWVQNLTQVWIAE